MLLTGLNVPLSVDVDPVSNHVYWAENGSNKIRRANFDGTGVTDIATAYRPPRGISLDIPAAKIYYTYYALGPHIQLSGANRVDFNGANDQFMSSDTAAIPWAIEADTPDGNYYVGQATLAALLSSGDKTTQAINGLASCGGCRGITHGNDLGNPKIFFSFGGTIRSMDPNGANVTTLPLQFPQPNIQGVDAWGLNQEWLAWGTDLGNTGTIATSKTDGSSFQIAHVAGGVKYTDVAVVNFVPPVPEPAGLTLAWMFVAGAAYKRGCDVSAVGFVVASSSI